MRRTIAGIALSVMLLGAAPAFNELVGRAHLAGCALSEHGPRSKHRCLDLRAELRAALRQARRDAFREAASLARQETDPRALADELERRAQE